MDDSLQKIVAASRPFFLHVFYNVTGVLLQKMLDIERIGPSMGSSGQSEMDQYGKDWTVWNSPVWEEQGSLK